ncbi:MAG TPA: hypothetical protein PKK13_05695 [Spirochaetota bacterium]|nr:hypothetical protein [Spirochaetota bacterium]
MRVILTLVFVLSCLGLFSADFVLDANNDGKPDRWLSVDMDKNWELLDVNRNKKADEGCFYVSEKNIVYRINEEKQDYNGDGKIDIWIKIVYDKRDFYKEISVDSNYDGKIDMIINEKNDFKTFAKFDLDFDGIFESTEEYSIGTSFSRKELVNNEMVEVQYKTIIQKKSEDTNLDGKMDSFFWTDMIYRSKQLVAEKPIKEEFDSNHDGKIDLWIDINYDAKGKMKEVVAKYDTNFDGKVDEWRYTNDKRQLIRIDKDINFDGKIDTVEKNPDLGKISGKK